MAPQNRCMEQFCFCSGSERPEHSADGVAHSEPGELTNAEFFSRELNREERKIVNAADLRYHFRILRVKK